ncbi:transmembrane protein 177 isoform X2 [Leptopilina boulardi]|nr:transmembrane protein 177 isoform X2 [Leptopilina boulardi]
MPESLKNLVNDVFDDLKFDKTDRDDIKSFIVCRFKPFNAGMLDSRNGAIIGIPWHFTYDDLIDVKIPQIAIDKFPIDITRFETEDLAESLILSREAKKFAIARELLTIRDSYRSFDAFLAAVIILINYTVQYYIKEKFHLYKKSLSTRILLYIACGFISYIIYFGQKDFFSKKRERNIDAELAKLNNDYLNGGHEYYSKLLTSNILQRQLLDEYGEKTYEKDGNVKYSFRIKSVPITERKEYFEMILHPNKETSKE